MTGDDDDNDNVLLLRAPSSSDRYETAFESIGYDPCSVPVLETVLVNLDELETVLRSGADAFGAVVFTSVRACEAWKTVAESILADGFALAQSPWSDLPFYVVGEATASSLRSLERTSFAPISVRGGSESGTAERLARFIIRDLDDASKLKKLLFLVGDKASDTLPDILEGAGLSLETVHVYGTRCSSTLESDLSRAVRGRESHEWWIVFFAPSAAAFVCPILRRYFSLEESSTDLPKAHIAAIGPTTAAFLSDALRLPVHVVSPKPNADSLSRAISEFDEAARI